MRILMLTPLVRMGYGIPEVLAALDPHLRRLGVEQVVGCLEADEHYRQFEVHNVRPDPPSVAALADQVGATAVVAHGSPYFEVLPHLDAHRTIAYEHGDPTPDFFADDAAERQHIADHKRALVYPAVTAVAAISEFIRHDIGWPAAQVIRNGCDHVPDLGAKPEIPPADRERPLQVGTLMRLGPGEARYKGNALLRELRERVVPAAPNVEFHVMGRGTAEDAQLLEEAGFRVSVNATDEERVRFLRQMDVFVSPSQWEGCNLPLVEAQALGTPGLAFDTGAHPEHTPFVFASFDLMAAQLIRYEADRPLVRRHGRMAHAMVRRELVWQRTAEALVALVGAGVAQPPDQPPVPARRTGTARLRIDQVRRGVRKHGMKGSARIAWRRIRSAR